MARWIETHCSALHRFDGKPDAKDNNGIEFKFPRKTGKTKGTWSWTRLERVTDRVTEEIQARDARARLRSLLETISDKGAIKLDEVARQFASSGSEEEE